MFTLSKLVKNNRNKSSVPNSSRPSTERLDLQVDKKNSIKESLAAFFLKRMGSKIQPKYTDGSNKPFEEQEEVKEDLIKLKSRENKFTHPMCISTYEPFSLIVFALANRQIILYQVKQTGSKMEFQKKITVRADQLPLHMSLG